MSGETMEILHSNLVSGAFKMGMEFYADKSNNWHTRLAVSKFIRALDKVTDEPFKEYQDLLREFGQRNAQGNLLVSPAALTKERAKEWNDAIKSWRDRTVKVETDLPMAAGMLLIKLPKEVMNTFPFQFMDAMMDNVTFVDAVETKEEEASRIRKERDEAVKKLEEKAP